jgi:hypothetical protein
MRHGTWPHIRVSSRRLPRAQAEKADALRRTVHVFAGHPHFEVVQHRAPTHTDQASPEEGFMCSNPRGSRHSRVGITPQRGKEGVGPFRPAMLHPTQAAGMEPVVRRLSCHGDARSSVRFNRSLAELTTLLADRYVGHRDPTGEQELFHIAVAEAEMEREPYRLADDLRREAIILVRADGRYCVQGASMAHRAKPVSADHQGNKAIGQNGRSGDAELCG